MKTRGKEEKKKAGQIRFSLSCSRRRQVGGGGQNRASPSPSLSESDMRKALCTCPFPFAPPFSSFLPRPLPPFCAEVLPPPPLLAALPLPPPPVLLPSTVAPAENISSSSSSESPLVTANEWFAYASSSSISREYAYRRMFFDGGHSAAIPQRRRKASMCQNASKAHSNFQYSCAYPFSVTMPSNSSHNTDSTAPARRMDRKLRNTPAFSSCLCFFSSSMWWRTEEKIHVMMRESITVTGRMK
mmetsp:Transcript_48460/g.125720  ORF Transcript_48460/g.125720 Transcript_48460/m.125720 type:complete len:243 (+) Transcript_48460:604-1332(+)